MTALYRDFLTREELDAAYDNTRAVADSARILVGFEIGRASCRERV